MLDFLKSAAKPPSDLLGIIRYVRARWRARLAVKGAVRLIAVNVAVFFLLAYLMQWSRFSATSILSARLLLAGPAFEPPLDRIIHAFKYEGGAALAPWIASLLPLPPALDEGIGREYVLTPVSLHPARRARRGYDQAALLAGVAAERWGIPLVEALARTRDHEPQARLDPDRRRANVRGVFRVTRPAAVRGRPVLLVDDVATTGSSLLEAAQALEEEGATWVLALSAAHGGLLA